MAENDFHEQAAVVSRSAGIQIDKDKPGINEDEQSALDDTTAINDDSISSGNSTFCYSYYWLLFLEGCPILSTRFQSYPLALDRKRPTYGGDPLDTNRFRWKSP